MRLLTEAQREQLLDNGRRQAAVKGTPGEIDFAPSSNCSTRAAPGHGFSRKSIPKTKPWPGASAISAWLPGIRDSQSDRACKLSRAAGPRHRTRHLFRGTRPDLGLHRRRERGGAYRRKHLDINGQPQWRPAPRVSIFSAKLYQAFRAAAPPRALECGDASPYPCRSPA